METLNIAEAAALLRMHPNTLAERAASGEIPGAKASKRWVFIKLDLLAWLRAKYMTPCHSINKPTPNFGLSISRSTGGELDDLLAPPTKNRRRNTCHITP